VAVLMDGKKERSRGSCRVERRALTGGDGRLPPVDHAEGRGFRLDRRSGSCRGVGQAAPCRLWHRISPGRQWIPPDRAPRLESWRIPLECAAPRQGHRRIPSGRVEAEWQPRSPPATRWMSRARAPAATTAARGRARASLGGRDCHHGSAVRRCRRRLHGG